MISFENCNNVNNNYYVLRSPTLNNISFVVISFKKCEWVHFKTSNIKFDVESISSSTFSRFSSPCLSSSVVLYVA